MKGPAVLIPGEEECRSRDIKPLAAPAVSVSTAGFEQRLAGD